MENSLQILYNEGNESEGGRMTAAVADPRGASTATDHEILTAYLTNPGAGIKGASVATKTRLALVSKVLKKAGLVSDPRALSGREYEDGERKKLDRLTDLDWAYIAGVFAAQKRGVYVTNGSVRIYMTIADEDRLHEVARILGVGEVNTFHTNAGKNRQFVYRMAREHQVKRFLEEMKKRLPVRHEWVEMGLGVLDGRE